MILFVQVYQKGESSSQVHEEAEDVDKGEVLKKGYTIGYGKGIPSNEKRCWSIGGVLMKHPTTICLACYTQ
jgi:hypothetical protein